jgi:hypothetical protein
MPKASRRTRTLNRSNNNPSIAAPLVGQISVNKPKTATQAYDASRYIKRDLVMSGLTAGIVIVILIILYLFLR